VELRLGQPDQALESFDAALAMAPADDVALMGRAQALVVLQRPDDAAATFDQLADAREAAGRHADACDALRRALEIQPTPSRRERYHGLTEELRRVIGDAEAERALALAPGPLEVDAVAPAATDAAAGDPAPGESPGSSPAGAPDDVPAAEVNETQPGTHTTGTDSPVAIVDGDALVLAAEEAAARGDSQGAVTAAMAAAQAFRAAGHPAAALDASVGGLSAGPGDVNLHLLIAELAFERGAVGSANDTYRRLVRLVEIEGDAAARDRILAAAREAFPDDSRFALP
jgi:tetratricopeptide (TPR) repeat protein